MYQQTFPLLYYTFCERLPSSLHQLQICQLPAFVSKKYLDATSIWPNLGLNILIIHFWTHHVKNIFEWTHQKIFEWTHQIGKTTKWYSSSCMNTLLIFFTTFLFLFLYPLAHTNSTIKKGAMLYLTTLCLFYSHHSK